MFAAFLKRYLLSLLTPANYYITTVFLFLPFFLFLSSPRLPRMKLVNVSPKSFYIVLVVSPFFFLACLPSLTASLKLNRVKVRYLFFICSSSRGYIVLLVRYNRSFNYFSSGLLIIFNKLIN